MIQPGKTRRGDLKLHILSPDRLGIRGRFVASLVIRGGGAGATLFVNILLARILGAAMYGSYMAGLSAAMVLGLVAVRGVNQLLTRELAAGLADNAKGRSTLARWSLRRVSIGVALSCCAYLSWVATGLSPVGGAARWNFAIAAMILLSLLAACTVMAGALNGFGASLRSQALLPILQKAGVLVSLPLWWFVLRDAITAASALWLQVAGYGLALVVSIYWLRAMGRKHGPENVRPGNESASDWPAASRRFLLVVIASVLVAKLDVVIVATLAGNQTAGIYSVGARVAQLALMVPLALNTILSPRISKAWSRGEREKLHRMIRTGLSMTLPIAIGEVVIAIFVRHEIGHIFGIEYFAAAKPFVWVTAGYALWTIAAPGYALLSMIGREGTVAALSWVILGGNVTAMFVLVPRYGATGAAISMAIGYALALPFLLLALRHVCSRSFPA